MTRREVTTNSESKTRSRPCELFFPSKEGLLTKRRHRSSLFSNPCDPQVVSYYNPAPLATLFCTSNFIVEGHILHHKVKLRSEDVHDPVYGLLSPIPLPTPCIISVLKRNYVSPFIIGVAVPSTSEASEGRRSDAGQL